MKTLSLENNEVIKAVFFILLAFISMFLVLMVFFYYSRKKIVKQTLVKKDLEIKHQKKLLQTVLFTQEEERKRIAQDLHDDISSKLNVVSLNSHLLTTPNLSEEEFAEITDNIIKLTTNALENSRRIAHDLLPPVLEKFGLNSGIEELVTEFNTTKVVLGFFELALAFKFLSNADLVKHWGFLTIEVFLGIWIIVFAGLAIYIFGKLKFPHDSPIKKLSFLSIFKNSILPKYPSEVL